MAGYTRQDTADNIANGNVIDATDLDNEFNQVQSAFNASTGHSHDGTAGEGAPIEKVGPSQDLQVTGTALQPKTSNTLDVGTSGSKFKDGHFDGTLNTDILSVDETSTFTGNVTASAAVSVGTTLTVTGATTMNGNVTVGNTSSDSLDITAGVSSHIIPSTDDVHDLGSSSLQWRDLYVNGTANIDSLAADTADIDGGTIDGAVIGGNSAAAITGTTITGTSFVGPVTGNVTGDLTGDVTGDVTGNVTGDVTGAVTGNADTATTLETARTIGGVSFDGSANIDLPGVNTAGNQNTTGSAATLTNSQNFSLTGDVTATAVAFDGSGAVTLSTTIGANSVALGTDTTGDYVSSLVAGTGVTLTNNSGESATPTLAIGQAVETDSNVQFNNVTVDGNLTVSGTTTTVSSTNTQVADQLFELGNGRTGTPSGDAGIVIERGSENNIFIGYDESADKFTMGTGTFTGASTGNLSITTGTLVSDLEGDVTGDVTGTADNATNINIGSNTSTDTTAYPVLVGASTTGNQAPFIDNSDLSYNASTGTLTAQSVSDSTGDLRTPKFTSTSGTTEITASGVYNFSAASTITFGTASGELEAGDIVVIYNAHTAAITIEDGDLTTFYLEGETTDKTSVTLDAASLATVTILSSTKGIISGSGVS